jgi:hypothetical protein
VRVILPHPFLKEKEEGGGRRGRRRMGRFRLKEKDVQVLLSLAQYRVLTTEQVTALHFRSLKVARRRLHQLHEESLVAEKHRGYGRKCGRPEKVFALSARGCDLLVESNHLPSTTSYESVSADNLRCLDHQILVNWFRIHLFQVEKVLPRLRIGFVASCGTPHRVCEYAPQSACLSLAGSDGQNTVDLNAVLEFNPDGVLAITDREQKKSVLFFVEVDLGTEHLASSKREARDVRQKIANYQDLSASERYKVFEKIFGLVFKRFRVLFVTVSPEREVALCRLIQEMVPSEFIWVTEQQRMFSQGLADAIWILGGKTNVPHESILNEEMRRPTPVLPLKP